MLSKAEPNLTAPYQLHFDPESGIYYFTTSKAINYLCRFRNITSNLSPILGVYDLEIYEFEFYPESQLQQKDRFDIGVCATICDLFNRFFTSELRVLTYVCESTDERHLGRHRLFGDWHRRFVANSLERIAIEVKIGDTTICGCALIQHTFPYMDVLQKEFIEKIEGVFAEKMG